MPGLEDITQLAQSSVRDEVDRRKRALADLDEQDAAAQEAERTSLVGLKQAHPGIPLSPNAQSEYSQQSVLNDNARAHIRAQREELTGGLPDPHELVRQWTGPAASILNENPQTRHDELATDPRARAARLDTVLSQLQGGGSADTAGSDRTFSVGKGAQGEPYFTNLSPGELHSEQHQANIIRGKMGEDALPPPVTDLTSLGHMGGGGGAFSSTKSGFAERGYTGGDPADVAKSQAIQYLQGESALAKQARPSPRDELAEKMQHEPEQDAAFANTDYPTALQGLHQKMLDGSISMEVGGQLEKKYTGMHNKALAANEGAPKLADHTFKALLAANTVPDARQAMHAATASPTDALQRANDDVTSTTQQATNAARTTGPGTSAAPTFDVNTPEQPLSPTGQGMQRQAALSRYRAALAPADPRMGRLPQDREQEIRQALADLLQRGIDPSEAR